MESEKQYFIIAVTTSAILMVLCAATALIVLIKCTRRKQNLLLERETRERKYEHQLAEAQLDMQEYALNMLSQEIHDNVGQILSLAKLNLNIIMKEQKENETFVRIRELVTQAITELRELGNGHYTEKFVEKGLVSAIKHQVDQLGKTGMFAIDFHTQLEHISLEKHRFIYVYRIVQELLNNIVKHSGADKVAVSILSKEELIQIVVSDNGKGFADKDKAFNPGIGLTSIRQRAAMIGAMADFNTSPGAGTIVHLSFKQAV